MSCSESQEGARRAESPPGGLIVLGMFACNWAVAECTSIFTKFAHQVFAGDGRWSSIASTTRTLANVILRDGAYSARTVDLALQDAFGDDATLFRHPSNGVSRNKCAVTAVRVEDVKTTIFASYNSTCRDSPDADHTDGHNQSRPLVYLHYDGECDQCKDPPRMWQV